MRGSLAPLRRRPFRLVFAARVVSYTGTAMAPIGLAFAILELTGSEADLGIVLACRSIPQVLFLLAGGVIADRLPRNLVMTGANVLNAVVQGTVALLLFTGHADVWSLALLAGANGIAAGFFLPASQGVIPQLISPEERQEANSLLRLGQNATMIGGAALGGVLVGATSPATAIAVDAATYLAASLLLVSVSLPRIAAAHAPSFVRELREGWDEVRSRTWLWGIVLQFGFLNACETGCVQVLGPGVAEDHLHGAAGWGSVLAAQGIGLVAGGLMMLRFRPRRLLLAATVGALISLPLMVALAVPLALPAVVALSFTTGIGMEIFSVLWDTALQQEIPQDRLSRVVSYDFLGSIVLVPFGLAAAGPISAAIGVSTTFWLALAVNLTATLAVLLLHEVRTLRRAAPDAAAA
jgi:MFS family permease